MAFLNFFKRKKHAEEASQVAQILAKAIAATLVEILKPVKESIVLSEARIMTKLSTKKAEVLDANKTVYGFYLVELIEPSLHNQPIKVDSMLVMVIAKSEVEAITKKDQVIRDSGKNPIDWQTLMMNYLPFYAAPERFEPIKAEKPAPAESYINNLLYARDNFAKTPYEKGVLTRIINNIKK